MQVRRERFAVIHGRNTELVNSSLLLAKIGLVRH
jgi:hypothetical protein